MKISKAQSQANRARIVETAATLFRQRGYDGVGVADLMAAAGLTHGGFYKHFESKADLMAEAAACGLGRASHGDMPMEPAAFISHYVSRAHRDGAANGCTIAALCGDAARQPNAIKAVFAAGVERMLAAPDIDDVAVDAAEDDSIAAAAAAERARKIALLAQMVGAVMLSRACPDDSRLADEILNVCRAEALTRVKPVEGTEGK